MPMAMAVGNHGQVQDGTALSQGKQEASGHVPEWQEVQASISEGISVLFHLSCLKSTGC